MKETQPLFDAFYLLAKEFSGRVTRGGIFTSQYPRLEGCVSGKDLRIYFKKESRYEISLCMRISKPIPFVMVIKPKGGGLFFGLDSHYTLKEIGEIPPFTVRSSDPLKGEIVMRKTLFRRSLKELVTPGILNPDEKKVGTRRQMQRTDIGVGLQQIDEELRELTFASEKIVFLPSIILDHHGAFMKVSFENFLHGLLPDDTGLKTGIDARKTALIRELISSHARNLDSMTNSF